MNDTLYELVFRIDEQIEIEAPVEQVFESVLQRLGAKNQSPGGPMPMKLEAWPGGRWMRDLKDGNGHLWGHVQVFKRPNLIELNGPLFMSYPVLSHLTFRVTQQESGSLLSFTHQALGMIREDHREGIATGWKELLEGVRQDAGNKK